MENGFGSNVTRSENTGDNVEYVINIEGQAKALVDANSQLENTAANYQQAEDFLARNIGIKSSPDVSGEKSLTYVVTTVDKDNPQNSNSPSSKDESVSISLDISGRADVFPVTFTGTLSGTAENDASDTSKGITLIETSSGTYSGITSGGNAVTTSNFDGWIIGIKNPDTTPTDGQYDAFPKSYNEIMLKVGDELFNAKTSANNSELVFNIPSSNLYVGGTDYPIKLITPEYFDSDLNLTFKTLSQGGAGDVAISSAIDRSVPIYSVADGVKTLEDPGNIVGVEDGAAIRLSVKVAREDTSENITQVKLTGKQTDFGISRNADAPNDTSNVVYLTRNVDGQLIENTFNEGYISRTVSGENIDYIIDIQGQAKALVGENGTPIEYTKMEDFLARNIGIKTSTDISGEKSLHTLLQL